MRPLTILFLFAFIPAFAQSSDEKDAIAAVENLFHAMTAHDAAMIRASMLPDAHIYAIRDAGAPSTATVDSMAKQIASNKSDLLERFTAKPTVSIRGRMAQVWGEYEFLRDAKFSHCGVDSVSLFKTAEGWKIAAIAYTAETTGCN